VSDGQRRRVQICVGLLKPFKVSVHVFATEEGRVNKLHIAFCDISHG